MKTCRKFFHGFNNAIHVLGHRYGSTLVPFSSEDKDAMKFRATKCLKLLCFTKQDHVSACTSNNKTG